MTTFDMGADLRVRRMGFGAMRLPAREIRGPANDRGTVSPCCAARWSSA